MVALESSIPLNSPATWGPGVLAFSVMAPLADWMAMAALLEISIARSASPVIAPVPTVETLALVSMNRSVPALRSIAPLPPVAVTLAEMVRWSSSPPSLVAVRMMSPPPESTTGVLITSGLAARTMISLPVTLIPSITPSAPPIVKAPVFVKNVPPVPPVASKLVIVDSMGSPTVPIPAVAMPANADASMLLPPPLPLVIEPALAVT